MITARRLSYQQRNFVTAILMLLTSTVCLAAVAPTAGMTARFSVLGNSAVTGSTGLGTAVTGDVGSSPNPAVTNFPPSSVVPPFALHLTNDLIVQQAHTDAITAYNFLAAQGPGTLLPAQLNGAVLTAGTYSFAGGAADLAATGTLTLNGPGVFVFEVDSALTMNVGSNVVGTADPCSVFWRVGTSATLNGISFRGVVIADASITVGSGANITGKLLAGTGATGAVTMAGSGGNTIGGCAVPTVVSCQTITVNPATLPNASANVPYNATLSATGGTGPYTFVITSGALPAGLTLNGTTGVISGTPTTNSTANFTISATEPSSCSGSRSYTLVTGTAAAGVPVLDHIGQTVLFILLAGAGLFVMSKL